MINVSKGNTGNIESLVNGGRLGRYGNFHPLHVALVVLGKTVKGSLHGPTGSAVVGMKAYDGKFGAIRNSLLVVLEAGNAMNRRMPCC